MIAEQLRPDDYDWPFPSRKETMYLSSLEGRTDRVKPVRESLVTNDIEGARPRPLPQRTTPFDPNSTTDIQARSAKSFYPARSRPQSSLRTDDISGAQPKCCKFVTKRNTNPLSPQYVVPFVQEVPCPPPKFVRDSFDVSDIPGTKTRVKFNRVRVATEQEQPPSKALNLARQFNILNCQDIAASPSKISHRVTSPLEPQYQMPGDSGIIKYPTVELSRPKTLCPRTTRVTDLSLKNDDIQGATYKPFVLRDCPPAVPQKQAALKNNFFGGQTAYQQTSRNKPKIAGTQVGSAKKGLVTNRRTNPLAPKYEMPGSMRPSSALQKFDSYIN